MVLQTSAYFPSDIVTMQISDEEIEDYLQRYRPLERQLQAFVQLRMALAPCIEAVILLDRLAFLLEQVRGKTLRFLNFVTWDMVSDAVKGFEHKKESQFRGSLSCRSASRKPTSHNCLILSHHLAAMDCWL